MKRHEPKTRPLRGGEPEASGRAPARHLPTLDVARDAEGQQTLTQARLTMARASASHVDGGTRRSSQPPRENGLWAPTQLLG